MTQIYGYADDLQLYSSCKAEKVEETLSILKDDINLILEWFSANKLKANPDKFQFIIFDTNKQLVNIPPPCSKIYIQDNIVEAAKEVKILGIQIDQTLSWNSHISQLKKSCAGKRDSKLATRPPKKLWPWCQLQSFTFRSIVLLLIL